MWRFFNACLDFFTDKTKPLVRFCSKVYRTFFAFYCNNAASRFLRFVSPFLNSSAVYRKKVLDSGTFEKFRFLSLVAIAVFAFFFMWKSSLNSAFVSAFSVVLMYFIYRGYRAAYVLACSFFALLTLVDFFYDGGRALLFLLGWGAASVLWFLAFNTEIVRVNLEKSFQLKKIPYNLHRDIVASILLALIVLGIALITNAFFSDKSTLQSEAPALSQDRNLSLAAGSVARHLFGYRDFCSKQGYHLVIYPEAFQLKFAPHIAKIQKDLSKYGETLESFYAQAKSRLGRKLDDSIAVDIENIRRQAIIELVAVKQNTTSQNVKWNEELSQLISTSEACAIFDEMAETILLKPNTSFQQITSY